MITLIKKPVILFIEKNVHSNEFIWVVVTSIICLILTQFIASFLSINSLCRKFKVNKTQIKQFLINILLFYVVIGFVTTYISVYKDYGVIIFIILSLVTILSMMLTLIYIKYKLEKNQPEETYNENIFSSEVVPNYNNNSNKSTDGQYTTALKILCVVLAVCMLFLIYTWFFKDKKTELPKQDNTEENYKDKEPSKSEDNNIINEEKNTDTEDNSQKVLDKTTDNNKKQDIVTTKLVCTTQEDGYTKKLNIIFKNNIFSSYESISTYTYSSKEQYSAAKNSYEKSKDVKTYDNELKIVVYCGTNHELLDGSEDEYKKLNLSAVKKIINGYGGYTCK